MILFNENQDKYVEELDLTFKKLTKKKIKL